MRCPCALPQLSSLHKGVLLQCTTYRLRRTCSTSTHSNLPLSHTPVLPLSYAFELSQPPITAYPNHPLQVATCLPALSLFPSTPSLRSSLGKPPTYTTPRCLLTNSRSMSCRKYLERRIVCAWKVVSQRSRRRHRASILPEDFVLLTTRRRSIRYV